MQEKAMVLQNEAGKLKCKNNFIRHTKCIFPSILMFQWSLIFLVEDFLHGYLIDCRRKKWTCFGSLCRSGYNFYFTFRRRFWWKFFKENIFCKTYCKNRLRDTGNENRWLTSVETAIRNLSIIVFLLLKQRYNFSL